jgi:hypothetical protein
MKRLGVLIVPLLCSAAGVPPAVESAINMARAAPGEFAADAMIRIAALDAVDKARKASLLEEAFRRASESAEPYRRRAAITKVQGSAGFFNRAYDQDLDALTLRVRAVEGLLALDQNKARELFLQIPPISLPKVKCTEFLVYDVSRYYDLLGRMAREGFTAAQIAKGEPMHLLLDHAGTITAPAQVIPMGNAILHSAVKDADFQALVAAYAGALGRISGDDRSYTYANSTGATILALVDELKKRKMSPLPLLEAYRLYLVVNLSGKRCADDDLMFSGAQSFGLDTGAPAPISEPAQYFNLSLRVPPLQFIQEAESQPSSTEGVAEGLRSCEDADCQGMAQQYRTLMFRSSGMAYSMDDRKGNEWQAQLQDFLMALANWKESSGASHSQYFRNKSGIYIDLMGLVPVENQVMVARALLDFVEGSKFQAENRIQWFLPADAVLGRAGLEPNGLGKLLGELGQSHDPVIGLYAQLEKLAPRGPEGVLKLL